MYQKTAKCLRLFSFSTSIRRVKAKQMDYLDNADRGAYFGRSKTETGASTTDGSVG